MINSTSIAHTGMFVAPHRLAQSADPLSEGSATAFEPEQAPPLPAASAATAHRPAGVTGEQPRASVLPPVPMRDAGTLVGSDTGLISEETEQLGALQAFHANRAMTDTGERTTSMLNIMA